MCFSNGAPTKLYQFRRPSFDQIANPVLLMYEGNDERHRMLGGLQRVINLRDVDDLDAEVTRVAMKWRDQGAPYNDPADFSTWLFGSNLNYLHEAFDTREMVELPYTEARAYLTRRI
jgi:hypothetical protein